MTREIGIAFTMTVLIGSLGCTSKPPQQVLASAPYRTEAATTTHPADTSPQQNVIMASGPITVEQQLDVVTLRSGVIASLNADVGSHIQKGQLLARLDDRQLAADRTAAEHKLLSIQADLKNWDAELEVRKVDMQRSEAMHKLGINTQEQYDHDRYTVTATQYEVERQREDALGAQSTLESIDLELEKTRIRAPFSGVVAQRFVRDGQYVTSGEKLFWITAESPLEVRFTLPENQMASLKRGDLVTVSSGPDSQRTTPARVSHISPIVDPASGMISVTAVLTGKLPGLLPGMIADIRIPTSR